MGFLKNRIFEGNDGYMHDKTDFVVKEVYCQV